MINTLELEIAIKRAGYTKRKIAKELNLSDMGFYNKIKNVTEFKASEIAKLHNLLGIENLEERQRIFFTL